MTKQTDEKNKTVYSKKNSVYENRDERTLSSEKLIRRVNKITKDSYASDSEYALKKIPETRSLLLWLSTSFEPEKTRSLLLWLSTSFEPEKTRSLLLWLSTPFDHLAATKWAA